MGWWSRLLGVDLYDAAQRVLPDPYEPFMGSGGIPVADPGYPLAMHDRTVVESFWRSQPNVRKVVDFIARNVASIPLHVHERVSDTDRRRVTDHALSYVMSTPRPGVGAYRFWHSVLSDGLLYDRWAVIKQPREDGGLSLVQVPSWRLRFDVDALRQVDGAWFWVGNRPRDVRESDRDGWRRLDLDALVFDHGYAPRGAGMSPIETLRDVLDENTAAVGYRRQVWENGARVPAWIGRPQDAGQWTPEQQQRFANHFRQTYTGNGENAGGVPILEDGMQLNEHRSFTPQDAQDLEGRRLTSIEVAASFHIAPELVGAQQGNYSNVREFRQMLYRDSLGPYIKSIEEALNAQLVPGMAAGRRLYVEANVESKLRGDFIEQATVKSSATGAPWLTRNEARALENRPPVPGGDDLVTPLNVIVGGQASMRDTGSQNRNAGTAVSKGRLVSVKARAPETHEARHAQVLADFFTRQGNSVRSRIGAGGDWWDQERWDGELTDDLVRLYLMSSEAAAEAALEAVGLDAYDVDRTIAFLTEAAALSAGDINATTRDQVEAALGDDDDPAAAVGHVFDVSKDSRAEQIATTAVTFASGFGAMEAARQNSDGATKTWRVTSGNPRASHAAMDGETVGIDDVFSNGLRWPGGVGDPDEVAGCRCEMDINIP